MHMLENVPSSILAVPQWVVWREEARGDGQTTKVPYQATDSMLRASPTNPDTWNKLTAAVKKAMLIGDHRFKSGTGFVITPDLGMVCIDLDDPYKLGNNALNAIAVHEEILKVFSGTYAEVSPSGSGYHIWMYGVLPEGRLSVSLKDKTGIEIYSGKRYMTMTGRQYGMCEELTDQQENLDKLVKLLTNINGGTLPNPAADMDAVEETTELGRESGLADAEVVQRAIRMNSRFLEFFNAQPQNDRSRFAKPVAGDLDKITSSPEQILRILLNSPIGRCYPPGELERKLFTYWLPEARSSNESILKKREEGRAMQQRMMEQEAARQAAADAAALEPERDPEPVEQNTETFRTPFKNCPRTISKYTSDFPPGVIGAMAQDIRTRATMRASRDFAVAAALALHAGLSGHAYSFERVNGALYMLMLGVSGQGKEAPAEARDVLADQLRSAGVAPSMLAGLTGPGRISSAQGLHRRLSADKNLLCIIGEGIIWLTDLIKMQVGNSAIIKSFILDLYVKQGAGRKLAPAEVLNKDNKLGEVMSPACTLLMEGEPSRYMELLGDDGYTSSGLCARIIHVFGDPSDLPSKYFGKPSFSPGIVNYLANNVKLWHQKTLDQNTYMAMAAQGGASASQPVESAYIQVRMTDECQQYHLAFDDEIDPFARANSGRIADIYNRIVPNILRTAINVAAGVNPYNPVIDLEIYQWAQCFVLRGLMHMGGQFDKGSVGTGDNRVREMILDAMMKWSEMLPAERERRLLTTGQMRDVAKRRMLSKLKGIPFMMLQRMIVTRAARYVNAERATMVMNAMLTNLREAGEVDISEGATEAGASYRGRIVFLADDFDSFNSPITSEV